METRARQLESVIAAGDKHEAAIRKQCIWFKGSSTFRQILDRLLRHYMHRLIPFADVPEL